MSLPTTMKLQPEAAILVVRTKHGARDVSLLMGEQQAVRRPMLEDFR